MILYHGAPVCNQHISTSAQPRLALASHHGQLYPPSATQATQASSGARLGPLQVPCAPHPRLTHTCVAVALLQRPGPPRLCRPLTPLRRQTTGRGCMRRENFLHPSRRRRRPSTSQRLVATWLPARWRPVVCAQTQNTAPDTALSLQVLSASPRSSPSGLFQASFRLQRNADDPGSV